MWKVLNFPNQQQAENPEEVEVNVPDVEILIEVPANPKQILASTRVINI